MAIYAVLGSGSMTRKNAVALLKDHLTEGDEVYLAASDLDDAGRFAADWAADNNIGCIIFHEGQSLDDYAAADARGPVENSVEAVLNGLRLKDGVLWFAYDEREPAGQEALLEGALRSGIKVFDLTDLLNPLLLDESEDPVVEVPAPVEVVPDEAQQRPGPRMAVTKESMDKAKAEPVHTVNEPEPVVEDVVPEPMEVLKAAIKEAKEKVAMQTCRCSEPADTGLPVRDPEEQALLALGQALKTILDYLKK